MTFTNLLVRSLYTNQSSTHDSYSSIQTCLRKTAPHTVFHPARCKLSAGAAHFGLFLPG